MAAPAQFMIEDRRLERLVRSVLPRLPATLGAPVRLQRIPGLRDRHGPSHAASFLRDRRIAFDCTRAEFPRVFVHELFHFAWIRLGNADRRRYEVLLAAEHRDGARGEMGWSAEWRKLKLSPRDVRTRTRRWREYCCESFCDTAAWLYSGVGRHSEFTLAPRFRVRRRTWFSGTLGTGGLSI